MADHYNRAIKILEKIEGENKDLIFEIASTNPSVFIRAYEKVYKIGLENDEVLKPIINDLKAGLKIPAIKKYRGLTGCSLVYAKDFVDRLNDELKL